MRRDVSTSYFLTAILGAALLSFIYLLPSSAGSGDPYEGRRAEMVRDQIEARGVRVKGVLEAMRKVPRHQFVPGHLRSKAYEDHPLPIGEGQTISQPYIVGLMTELLGVEAGDRVLEVGTGSGYQAAVLSGLVSEVVTMEIFDTLADAARERLGRLGYRNVTAVKGDGYYGYAGRAPFDGIIVTCAAPHVPPPLIEQLKEGGRMVIPVGGPFMTQTLMVVKKGVGGDVSTESVLPVIFVPLLGH